MGHLGPRMRFVAFAWAYVECLCYSGIMFGWGSLVYVLKDEGLYLHLCDHSNHTDSLQDNENNSTSVNNLDSGTTCEARDEMFNLVFTIATAVLGLGICLLGFLSVKYGTRVTRIAATLIFVVGSICCAAASKDVPWLLFPGVSLVAIAGTGIFATNAQISFLFPVWGSLVVALLSGTFDASSCMQLLVKLGHENGLSRSTFYYILCGVFSLSLVNTFCFLPKRFIKPPKEKGSVDDSDDGEGESFVSMQNRQLDEKPDVNYVNAGERGEGKQPMELTPSSIARAVLSPELSLHMYWFMLLHLSHINYQASVNTVLEQTLDSDVQVSEYTNVLMYSLMAGTVVCLLPGFAYDYNVKLFKNNKSWLSRRLMPAVFPLLLTSVFGSLLATFSLFTSSETLYVEFVLLVFMRSFLYSTLCTYVRQLFPSGYFTALYGIANLLGGLISLLQHGLFVWAENHGKKQVDIFLLALNVSTLIHPIFQWRRARKG